jgi:hypothetical protein
MAVGALAAGAMTVALPANPANVEFARGQVLTLIERGLLNEA